MYGASEPLQPAKVRMEGLALDRFAAWVMERPGLWPGIFTLCVSAIFAAPLVVAWRLIVDPSARYWTRHQIDLIVVVVIFLVVVCHLLHMRAGRPRFWPTFFSTLFPALVLALSGYFIMTPLGHIGDELRSPDCTSNSQKFEVEMAYRRALEIFDACVTRVASATKASVKETAPLLDLTDCAEYKSAGEFSKYGREWVYLEALETSQFCSGWCTPGSPALWSRTHDTLDLCASVSGIALQEKVGLLGGRMLVLGFAIFIACLIAIFYMGETMTKNGFVW
jgi:hypothetical protein